LARLFWCIQPPKVSMLAGQSWMKDEVISRNTDHMLNVKPRFHHSQLAPSGTAVVP
jgi:hypothetical protein